MENRPCARRLLVVDDDTLVLQIFADLFGSRGFAVTSARNGQIALDFIHNQDFDLVLTDLGVPLVDGWTIAKQVKAKNPLVPVILLTGWCVAEQETDLQESTVDLILTKPCSSQKLLGAIEMLLSYKAGPSVELRKFKRLSVSEGAFLAIMEPEATHTRVGELIDFSKGGLSLRYMTNEKPLRVSSCVEIYKYEYPDLRLKSCKIVYDIGIRDETYCDYGSDTRRRCGIQFMDQSRNQLSVVGFLFQGMM
jgi:CheY-like chemotaxis protein